MDRQIAFILAGAFVALGVGVYLMSESFVEYDLDSTATRDQARVERLEDKDESDGPGLIAMLFDTVSGKLEVARNQYLGEHLPETPEGWTIKKTSHGEIIDFTVDYKLENTLNDMSSMRRMMGMGSANTMRQTDVAFHKDEKVIFLRLGFANVKRDKPVPASASQLFIGKAADETQFDMVGMQFTSRTYENSDVINIFGRVGHFTAIGVLTNASMADVQELLSTMDLGEFAALSGDPSRTGGMVAAKSISGKSRDMVTAPSLDGSGAPTAKPVRKASPKGNLLAGLPDKEDEEVAQEGAVEEPKTKRRGNLLGSLLGSGVEEVSKRSRTKDEKAKGGGFQRVGNFTSRCKTGHVTKTCKVE